MLTGSGADTPPESSCYAEAWALVIRTDSVVGFPVIITAPLDQGLICIAKMAGYTSPVVLYFVEFGASVGPELQALYPKASGRYSSASFEAINRINFEIRMLGGSPALVLGDPRFDCLFVACVGTFSPVLIERLTGGRLVNVSDQFPSIIRAYAVVSPPPLTRSGSRPTASGPSSANSKRG